MLYQDPAKPRARPSLIGALLAIPAKATNHQLENQATAVLAWLIDRSPAVAEGIVRLFIGAHLPDAGIIGARTWISLPQPGGGTVFPDLCIEASDNQLQLLVEVKVASEFATYGIQDGLELTQPAYYRYAWAELAADSHLERRAVGTLTRTGGTTAVDLTTMTARDVTWEEVRQLLTDLRDRAQLEPGVGLIADSFAAAIGGQISPTPVDAGEYDTWYAEHARVIERIARRLAHGSHSQIKSISGGQYRGFRVRLVDRSGIPLFLRVYGSPAGARLTVPGWPDAVIVGVERDPNGTLEQEAANAASAAGFLRLRDFDGYWLHRDMWPINRAAEAPVAVADEIAERLAESGLLPDQA